MKIIVRQRPTEDSESKILGILEGDNTSVIEKICNSIKNGSFKEQRMALSFPEETSKEEMNKFYDEFEKEIVKQDLLDRIGYHGLQSLSFAQKGKRIFNIRKGEPHGKEVGYISSNHLKELSESLIFLEPKTGERLELPDYMDPVTFKQRWKEGDPFGPPISKQKNANLKP